MKFGLLWSEVNVLHGSVEFFKPGFVAGDGRFVLFCRPIEIDGGQHECLAMYEGCRRRGNRRHCPTSKEHLPDSAIVGARPLAQKIKERARTFRRNGFK